MEEKKFGDVIRMEQLALRRVLQRQCNELDSQDRNLSLNALKDKSGRLFRKDAELLNFMVSSCTEQEYEQEMLEQEEYRDLVLRAEHFLQDTICGSDRPTDVQKISRPTEYRLPKLTLVAFNLSPKNWCSFYSQFKHIYDNPNMTFDVKFQYLLQSVSGQAKTIVESYPPSQQNLELALQQLHDRFGRPDLIIEAQIRDLLELILNKNKKVTLSTLFDTLNSKLRTLESLGVAPNAYQAFLYPLVESALPSELIRSWSRSESANSSGDRLAKLLSFIEKEVRGEERVIAIDGFMFAEAASSWQPPTAVSLATAVVEKEKKKCCTFCDLEHNTWTCPLTKSKSAGELRQILRDKKACLKCASLGHFSRLCRARVACGKCFKNSHLTFLCYGQDGENSVVPTPVLCSTLQDVTFLQTVVVDVVSAQASHKVRVLCDSGSQRSYITKQCASRIKAKQVNSVTINQAVFGGGVLPEKRASVFEIVLTNKDFSVKVRVIEQEVICKDVPKCYDKEIIEELRMAGISLSDTYSRLTDIDILIGADILGTLLTGKQFTSAKGPVAVETLLGWVIYGRCGASTDLSNNGATITSLCLKVGCDVTNLWALETLGVSDPIESQRKAELHNEALKEFNRTLRIDEDGRYEVMLPWKKGHPVLGCNRVLAEQRLVSVTRKLKASGLFSDYDAVFRDWFANGIIERAPAHIGRFYLPHRAVLKPSSLTTKIRPVFDASAKIGGISLNDCLEAGPNMLEKLFTVLCRFRMGPLGVQADISKAFPSVGVNKDDREYLRFLWWDPMDGDQLIEFRHRRVPFGVTSSSFLLNGTIDAHLKAGDSFLETRERLKHSFYVDDVLSALKTLDKVLEFKKEAEEIMSQGYFQLVGWRYTGDGVNNMASTLGLYWNTETDFLSCNVSNNVQNAPTQHTKRSLLSLSQGIFDPIGVAAPATISLKILIQRAWKENLAWDSPLPEFINRDIKTFVAQSHYLRECKIPRALWMEGTCKSLHIFSDSSMEAYAACAFIREVIGGQVLVRLVCAKNRVAPISRKTNIPRLELMGALLASRIADNLINTCFMEVDEVYIWTDSTVVLYWLQHVDEWNTFVSNRIREIRSVTPISWWRHIPGTANVSADLLSRGCTPKELAESRWWSGPQWLQDSPLHWPIGASVGVSEEAIKEKKVSIITSVVSETTLLPLDRYFSKYGKIVRMVGWVLRFISLLRSKRGLSSEEYRLRAQNNSSVDGLLKQVVELTVEELAMAETVIFKQVQATLTERDVQGLQLIRNESGLLCVETKLLKGSVEEDFRTPILLPGKNEIVKRFIRDEHVKNFHAGTGILLSIMRERVWILKARQTIKSILFRCMNCMKLRAKAAVPAFAPLPLERTTHTSKCFENVGCDLFGPVTLQFELKNWVVIFTCCVYRAVHFEIVDAISTEAFLRAFRRFMARRGRVSVVISDCGTNFVGSQNLLDSLDWELLEEFCAIRRITWKRNPPASPWYGGFFERLIRQTKDLMKRSLGMAYLTADELATVLCDIESLLNNRPLTHMSDDPQDLTALTPAFFLQDIGTGVGIGFEDLDIIEQQLCRRARHLKEIRDGLRARFFHEYLSQLINKGERKLKAIKPGDLVLIENDNKRILWPLARVVELLPGRDRQVRMAKVRTATGEFLRPLQRLFPLELEGTEVSHVSAIPDESQIQPHLSDLEEVDESNIVIREKNDRSERAPLSEPDLNEQATSDECTEERAVLTSKGRRIRPPKRLDL